MDAIATLCGVAGHREAIEEATQITDGFASESIDLALMMGERAAGGHAHPVAASATGDDFLRHPPHVRHNEFFIRIICVVRGKCHDDMVRPGLGEERAEGWYRAYRSSAGGSIGIDLEIATFRG